MSEPFDVVVAGCGPAGAVCASLLGRLGVRTLAVERARAIYDKPRAFALDHEVMRVFQNLGIAAAVAPHTAPFTPSEYYGVDGTLIKRLGAIAPPYPMGWTPSLVFNQPAVEGELRRLTAGLPGVELALGTRLLAFAQSDAGVTVQLEDDGGRIRELSARYLVGCDGASSTVRRLLGVEQEDLGFDEPWLVVDVLVNDAGAAKLPTVSAQYCEPARPCTYLIGPGAHRRWEIMLLPGEDPRAMEDEQQIWRLLQRWISPADARLWRAASYRFHALVARTWRAGRIFIAGDAAHQQPPFTGQGMCQGIRDVANLAWKLQRVLSGRAHDRILDTYETERGAHVRRLTGVIKNIGRLICERDPAAARARDARLLAEAGGKVRTVPRQNLIPPLEGGFLDPRPHPANGTLFPQPRVRHEEGTVLLDDVAGDGFRLVVRGQGDGRVCAPPTHFLRSLDARVVCIAPAEEADGVLERWFERHACVAALVRPDHYVFGVADTDHAVEGLLENAIGMLQ